MNTKLVVLLVLKDRDERILLIKRANTSHGLGKWCLPAGKVEQGEKLEEACKREAKEEVNLDVYNVKLFLSRIEQSTEQVGKVYDCNYFVADFKGKVKINGEASDFRWFTEEDLQKEETVPDQRDVLEKLFKKKTK
jgi:mutator protein MutT